MTAQPCICPTNDQGLRTATDPKCFDHAPWNRHPSDYVVRLRIPRRVAALTLTAAAVLVPLSAAPAQAADPYIWVCNSPNSDDNITAWHLDLSTRVTIHRNECKSVNDRSGHARVDVDPDGGYADIDSYQIFTDYFPFSGPATWGPCHNGENGSSDPDSSHVKTSHYVTKKYSCGAGT